MKKWILWLLAIIVPALLSIYLFIPSKIVISLLSKTEATLPGELRMISHEENWRKWWRNSDGKSPVAGEVFTYGNSLFHLDKPGYNAVLIDIEQGGIKIHSTINLISYALDSTGVAWYCETPATFNPLTRIRNYLSASEIQRNMRGVMHVFSEFISAPKNIYGMSIYQSTMHDTLMASARFMSPDPPNTARIYGYFDTLKQMILKQHARPVGFPIMNLRKMADGRFETQAAVPTDRILKNEGKISAIRMPPGLFLTADIKGGAYSVDEAMRQMELFAQEYNRVKIATNFQVLITDRRNEPDTSKWITTIKMPIVPLTPRGRI